MQKESDPEWAKSEPPAEPAQETDPKQAVPMQKPAPKWAQTVPAPAGEPLPETELPATASKRTWPPAGGPQNVVTESDPGAPTEAPSSGAGRAQEAMEAPGSGAGRVREAMDQDDAAPAQGAVPEEVDIWPPEPPTEHTMPAWPPSSTISEGMLEPSTRPGAEPISSWPDSFDSVPEVTKPPASTAPPAASKPPAANKPPVATKPPAASRPPAATVPPAATAPPVPTAPTLPPAMVVPIAPTVPPAAAAAIAPPVPPAAPAPPAPVTASSTPPAPAASTPPALSAPAPAAPPQQSSDPAIDWPDAVAIPAWAPQIHVTTQHQAPLVEPSQPAPQPRPQQPPAAAQPPPAPPASKPPSAPPPPPPAQTPTGTAGRSSWEVVEQRRKVDPKKVVPTPEDRSYAEWFAWAKRGGAPAGACHAAAQGAFQALSSGKDVATAVQWATAAMTRPPVPVSADRQSYCAWFSLAHIDLNLDQHRAHAFATAAVHALDAGADAAKAHAAGLHAAGIK